MSWQLQEAKSKFSQVINLAQAEGPQIVTRHGAEVAVIVSIADYRAAFAERPALIDLLLGSPLAGSELVLERDAQDFGREVEL